MKILADLVTGEIEVSSGDSSGLGKLFRLPQIWLGLVGVAIVLASELDLALSKEEVIGAALVFVLGFAIGKVS